MADKTAIQWTDATWNPLRGCTKVSEGCRNCYAMNVAYRYSGPSMPYEGLARKVGDRVEWTNKIMLVPAMLDQPLRWQKPRMIFVNSMSDLFHEDVPFEFIWKVFDVMRQTPRHTYQILTKRPQRMADFFDWLSVEWLFGRRVFNINWSKPHPNNSNEIYTRRGKEIFARCFQLREEYAHVWLGVSVEDQKTADERIPLLLKTPAAVRWISAEPLLWPVNLSPWLACCPSCGAPRSDRIADSCGYCENHWDARGLNWIVVGGESGPGARPYNLGWALDIVEQCRRAVVPCFVKQLGSFPVVSYYADDDLREWTLERPHTILSPTPRGLVEHDPRHEGQPPPGALLAVKLSKSKGGDIDEFPDVLKVREYPDALGQGLEVING